MQVSVDFCLIPIGVGVSLAKYVAACKPILDQASVSWELHAYGTLIEGDWDDVFTAIKACHQKVHEMGAPRITTTLKVGTRTDKAQTMSDKVSSVMKLWHESAE
ncbi:MTH1187 family thiamine-binding protein [Spartinivicinus ruber]|uniref:MTH1187 family thiamine-binding protein n=1 Tax=Spartinivicinus ruber TaxID=2683272 RepID=UPI0013D10E1B|nr:MTH1187 family thiamine-binding protein [Spartinivicinus ruber]